MFLDVLEMTTSYVQYLYLLIRIAPADYPDFFTRPFIVAAYFVLDWVNNNFSASKSSNNNSSSVMMRAAGNGTMYMPFGSSSSSTSSGMSGSMSSRSWHNVIDDDDGATSSAGDIATLVALPPWLPMDYRLRYIAVSVLTPLCISTLGYLCVGTTSSYLFLLLLLASLFTLVFGGSLLAGHYPASSYDLVPLSARAAMMALGIPCSLLIVVVLTRYSWRQRRAQYVRRQQLLHYVTHEEQRERASRAMIDKVIAREDVSVAALALHRAQRRRRAAALRRVRWRDVLTQSACALLLLLVAMLLLGVWPVTSLAPLQRYWVFRLPGAAVLVASVSCATWVLLSLSRRGRVVCRWLRELVSRYILLLLTFALSFLYMTMVTYFVSVLYCFTATCDAGTRLRAPDSAFPPVSLTRTSSSSNGNTLSSSSSTTTTALVDYGGASSLRTAADDTNSAGIDYACVALDVYAHPQRCPTSLQQSIATQPQRTRWLVYDPTLPCDAIDGKFRACAGLVFGGYVLLIPCLQLLLARYARRVLRREYPLERRYVDALTPQEQYDLKINTSDNPAQSVFRAYKPEYSYYSMSFMLQKMVLAIVSLVMQRGVRREYAWVAQLLFAVVAGAAAAAAAVFRPFARPTEAAYFPALQSMIVVTALYSLLGHFAHDAAVTRPLGVLLAVLLIAVPLVTLVAATIATLRGRREREERLRQRLAQQLAFEQQQEQQQQRNAALCAYEAQRRRSDDDDDDGHAMTRRRSSASDDTTRTRLTTAAHALVLAPRRGLRQAMWRLKYILCVIMAAPDAFASTLPQQQQRMSCSAMLATTTQQTTGEQQQQQQAGNVLERDAGRCSRCAPRALAPDECAATTTQRAAAASGDHTDRNEVSMCSRSHVSVLVNDAHHNEQQQQQEQAPQQSQSLRATTRRGSNSALSMALAEVASYEAAAMAERSARDAQVAAMRRIACRTDYTNNNSITTAAATTTMAAAAADWNSTSRRLSGEQQQQQSQQQRACAMSASFASAAAATAARHGVRDDCSYEQQLQLSLSCSRDHISAAMCRDMNNNNNNNSMHGGALVAMQPSIEYNTPGYVFVPALYFAPAYNGIVYYARQQQQQQQQQQLLPQWRRVGRRARDVCRHDMTDGVGRRHNVLASAPYNTTTTATRTATLAAAHSPRSRRHNNNEDDDYARQRHRRRSSSSSDGDTQSAAMSAAPSPLHAAARVSFASQGSMATPRATPSVRRRRSSSNSSISNDHSVSVRSFAQQQQQRDHHDDSDGVAPNAVVHFVFPVESSSSSSNHNSSNNRRSNSHKDESRSRQHTRRADAATAAVVRVDKHSHRHHHRGLAHIATRTLPSCTQQGLRSCARGVVRVLCAVARRVCVVARVCVRALCGLARRLWWRLLTATEHRHSGNAVANTHAHVLTYADVCARRVAATTTAGDDTASGDGDDTMERRRHNDDDDGVLPSRRYHASYCRTTASMRQVRHVLGHESPSSLHTRTASTLVQLRLCSRSKEQHCGRVVSAAAAAAKAQQQDEAAEATTRILSAALLDVTPYLTCARERQRDIQRWYDAHSCHRNDNNNNDSDENENDDDDNDSGHDAAADEQQQQQQQRACHAAAERDRAADALADTSTTLVSSNRPRLLSLTIGQLFGDQLTAAAGSTRHDDDNDDNNNNNNNNNNDHNDATTRQPRERDARVVSSATTPLLSPTANVSVSMLPSSRALVQLQNDDNKNNNNNNNETNKHKTQTTAALSLHTKPFGGSSSWWNGVVCRTAASPTSLDGRTHRHAGNADDNNDDNNNNDDNTGSQQTPRRHRSHHSRHRRHRHHHRASRRRTSTSASHSGVTTATTAPPLCNDDILQLTCEVTRRRVPPRPPAPPPLTSFVRQRQTTTTTNAATTHHLTSASLLSASSPRATVVVHTPMLSALTPDEATAVAAGVGHVINPLASSSVSHHARTHHATTTPMHRPRDDSSSSGSGSGSRNSSRAASPSSLPLVTLASASSSTLLSLRPSSSLSSTHSPSYASPTSSMRYGGDDRSPTSSRASAIASIMSAPLLPRRRRAKLPLHATAHADNDDDAMATAAAAEATQATTTTMTTRWRAKQRQQRRHRRRHVDVHCSNAPDNNNNEQDVRERNADALRVASPFGAGGFAHGAGDKAMTRRQRQHDDDDNGDESSNDDDSDGCSSTASSDDSSSSSSSDSSDSSSDSSSEHVDMPTALERMRYYRLLREQLTREYWRDRERLRAVQQSIDDKLYDFTQHALQLFLVALACLTCAALALAVSSSLAQYDVVDDDFVNASRSASLQHELVGYASWTAFVQHCCCAAVVNMTAAPPYNALDAEQWVCDNGVTKERVRRDVVMVDDDDNGGGDKETDVRVARSGDATTTTTSTTVTATRSRVYDGYAVRPLCGLQFAPGCVLTVRDDAQPSVQMTCDNASIAAEALARW